MSHFSSSSESLSDSEVVMEVERKSHKDKALQRLKRELESLEAGTHWGYIAQVREFEEREKKRMEAFHLMMEEEKKAIEKESEEELARLELEKEELLALDTCGKSDSDNLAWRLRESRDTENHKVETLGNAKANSPGSPSVIRRKKNVHVVRPLLRRKKTAVPQLDAVTIQEDAEAISRALDQRGLENSPEPQVVQSPGRKQQTEETNVPGEDSGIKDGSISGDLGSLRDEDFGSEYSSPEFESGGDSDEEIALHPETKIENGKLFYDRLWFHRGQAVFIQGMWVERMAGLISSISHGMLVFGKEDDLAFNFPVPLEALKKGTIIIERRAR